MITVQTLTVMNESESQESESNTPHKKYLFRISKQIVLNVSNSIWEKMEKNGKLLG